MDTATVADGVTAGAMDTVAQDTDMAVADTMADVPVTVAQVAPATVEFDLATAAPMAMQAERHTAALVVGVPVADSPVAAHTSAVVAEAIWVAVEATAAAVTGKFL